MHWLEGSRLRRKARFWRLYATRHLGRVSTGSIGLDFAPGADAVAAISRIYVINLDRKADRWQQMKRELNRLRGRDGAPVAQWARRHSATDARHIGATLDPSLVDTSYLLADQLRVQPNRLLAGDPDAGRRLIQMSRQEVAVALSHISVWKRIAAGDIPYTLVLEDDSFFTRRFAKDLDRAWDVVVGGTAPVDLLYLSYVAVDKVAAHWRQGPVFTPTGGMWQLSGYVLTKGAATHLLSVLPVRGPVDLWMNHQFDDLTVAASARSVIEQRLNTPSTNFYSAVPVLAQSGALTREKPARPPVRRLPRPVVAFGNPGRGLTSLAAALSVLGYRCCSDVYHLSPEQAKALKGRGSKDVFDAFVNVGDLDAATLVQLAGTNRGARFIWASPGAARNEDTPLTDPTHSVDGQDSARHGTDPHPERDWADVAQRLAAAGAEVLALPVDHPDPWELLCRFLTCEYPTHPYPSRADLGQRHMIACDDGPAHAPPPGRRWDTSPWVLPARQGPIRWSSRNDDAFTEQPALVADLAGMLGSAWRLRDDTFPSNLALFRPGNFIPAVDGPARLTLRREATGVRELTSAAVATTDSYRYGRVVAVLRPARGSGLITGLFLHRNTPRQEIDIEFLGDQPTKLMTNVFYNPGDDGTRLEYGYQGTPVVLDLGFDATAGLHEYEIEWLADLIRWKVDGRIVHERHEWGPTPIPDLPMELNVNLWHSRSRRLAGLLDVRVLPASADVGEVRFHPLLAATMDKGSACSRSAR